jgi:hypothetical protein
MCSRLFSGCCRHTVSLAQMGWIRCNRSLPRWLVLQNARSYWCPHWGSKCCRSSSDRIRLIINTARGMAVDVPWNNSFEIEILMRHERWPVVCWGHQIHANSLGLCTHVIVPVPAVQFDWSKKVASHPLSSARYFFPRSIATTYSRKPVGMTSREDAVFSRVLFIVNTSVRRQDNGSQDKIS